MNIFARTPIVAATGLYTGDGTNNKPVAHGLGRIPSVILIARFDVYSQFSVMGNVIIYTNAGSVLAVNAMDSVYFYVGNIADYGASANFNGLTYHWTAV